MTRHVYFVLTLVLLLGLACLCIVAGARAADPTLRVVLGVKGVVLGVLIGYRVYVLAEQNSRAGLSDPECSR